MPKVKKIVNEKLPSKRVSCDEERETIIRLEKLSNMANIYSSDKPTISNLKRNKYCTLLREDRFGAEFEIEKSKINIDTTVRVREKRQREKA